MSEQNNYLSADDFLAGVLNEPVDYELAGLGWVQVRGLTYAEVIATQKRVAGDNFGLTLETVRLGRVQPVLPSTVWDSNCSRPKQGRSDTNPISSRFMTP